MTDKNASPVEAIIRAGNAMSNILYNISQAPLSDDVDMRARMKECQVAWDAALCAPTPAGQPVAVRALDLSNALCHAFMSGRTSSEMRAVTQADKKAWAEYDPDALSCYQRIRSALSAPLPAQRETWTREDMAYGLAEQDGIYLMDIRSTVGPSEDADNWREYLGRADDLMAHLSLACAPRLEAAQVRREAFEEAAKVALAIDSGRGNEKKISRALTAAALAAAQPVKQGGGL